MDPILKSTLTSFGMVAATGVATWAVHAGIIQAGDQSNLASYLVAFGGAAVTGLLAVYKGWTQRQTALIQEVNKADNGVKVVANTASAPQVDAPLK